MRKHAMVLTGLLLVTVATPALAGGARDDILAGYAAQAKAEDAAFAAFSPEKGKLLYEVQQTGGNADTPSCSTCHTGSPLKPGQTRAGKVIEPMAVSVSPDRFTDASKVEKWFGRNCTSVLGRSCTAQEKGDFISYLSSL